MPYQGSFNVPYIPLVAPSDPMELFLNRQSEQEKSKREAQRDIFLNQLTQAQTGREQQQMEAYPEMQAAKIASEKAHAKYWESGGARGGVSGATWRNLPQDVRRSMIAQGAAYGLSPEEVSMHIGSGGTLNELKEEAAAKGVDVENAMPINVPTTANIKEIKSMESRAAELDYLTDATAKDFSVYGETFGGYSPAQIRDASKGDKETRDKLIKFLGARALQPEIAAARSAIAGGSNAQEALKHVQEAALGNIKVPGWTITPEIRQGVQEYINDQLRRGFEVRKKSMLGIKQKEKAEKRANERFGEMAGGNVRGIINGEEVEIPRELAEEFTASGGRINE